MALYRRPPPPGPPTGLTEFDILKASHKFLRDDNDKPASWDDHLAAKYYSNLYREFAVCDLKHYKSGHFALRWRTEEEVLAGSGETTCGNTRCERHFALSASSSSHTLARLLDRDDEPYSSSSSVPLTTLELPFAYVEHEESKNALVKVVLCGKCLKKLMWKKTQEKKSAMAMAMAHQPGATGEQAGSELDKEDAVQSNKSSKRRGWSKERERRHPDGGDDVEEESRKKRRRRSRSRSLERQKRGSCPTDSRFSRR